MVEPLTIQAEKPIVAESATPAESKLFHGIVRKLGQLPECVQRTGFRLGEDSDDAPAVWAIITVENDLGPSPNKVAEVNGVTRKLQTEMLRRDAARWPYVEIVTG